MKTWLLLIICCVCGPSFAKPLQDHTLDLSAVWQLASALGIQSNADLIAETQRQWLRKAGSERWEMNEISPAQKEFVLHWASKYEFFSCWKPSCKIYDQALILGATTGCMQIRLDYLKQLWNEGIRFHEVVWLTGERPLDERIDCFIDCCLTESQAAYKLWEKADLPEAMRKLPVVFIAVPMKGEGAVRRRPNTEDTILAWLDNTKGPCSAVFISDQPFCGYQFAVVKSKLPDAFLFDVVGPGVDPTSLPAPAAIVLDAIARRMYTEMNSTVGR